MSGASAEAGSAPRRESIGGVLGTSLCLLLIPALLLAVLASQGAEADGPALVSELFAASELPHGFEVQGAAELPGGDRVVLLRRPMEGDAAPAGDEVPAELSLVFYAGAAGGTEAMETSSPFGSGRGRRGRGRSGGDWDEGFGEGDASVLIQYGVLEWDDWSAAFVHHRTWESAEDDGGEEKDDEVEAGGGGEGREGSHGGEDARRAHGSSGGPGFPFGAWKREGPARDTLRVNLSTPRRLCVLYATWPPDVEARVEWMERLLAELEYRGPEGAEAGG